MAVCGYELLNERKTASLGRCRFTIGKTGVQPTMTATTILWIQLSERGALQFLKYGIFKEKVYVM